MEYSNLHSFLLEKNGNQGQEWEDTFFKMFLTEAPSFGLSFLIEKLL